MCYNHNRNPSAIKKSKLVISPTICWLKEALHSSTHYVIPFIERNLWREQKEEQWLFLECWGQGLTCPFLELSGGMIDPSRTFHLCLYNWWCVNIPRWQFHMDIRVSKRHNKGTSFFLPFMGKVFFLPPDDFCLFSVLGDVN